MKKIDLGQMTGIVANIGVIAGIVFLAFELRQNTESVRASAAATFLQSGREGAYLVFSDRELAELWDRGATEFSSLDRVDQNRLIFYEAVAIRTWAQNHGLYEKRLLTQEEWDRTLWEMEFIIPSRQSVRASWEVAKESFTDEFQEIFESFIIRG